MLGNHQFKNDYMKLMEKLMSEGYETELTAGADNGRCCYLHH